jgi:hypothetical protein
MNNITKIINAIDLAKQHKSKLPPEVLSVEGMSSTKFRHLLNNLVDSKTRYLDIGTWKGSTVISAIYGNKPEFYVTVDDWSCHGNCTAEFYNNFRNIIKEEPNFINQDSFTIDLKANNITDINLYLYDGGHLWEQHYDSIIYFYESLADEFILVVDDYDEKKIQSATQMALSDKKIKIEYSEYLTSAGNRNEWWCGTYIAACKK